MGQQTNQPPSWWSLLQLGAVAFHIPIVVMTGHKRFYVVPYELLLVGALVLLVSFAGFRILAHLLDSEWRALSVTTIVSMLFWHWSADSPSPETIATWTVPVIVFGLAVAVASKYSSARRFQIGIFVATTTFASTLAIVGIANTQRFPEPALNSRSVVYQGELTRYPDIYFILLDAYAGAGSLEAVYEFDNSSFYSALEQRGLDVAENAIANYSYTHLSLASILQMDYLRTIPGAKITTSDFPRLAEIVSGDNSVTATLKEAGYTIVHGASENWVNRCGPNTDYCLRPPLFSLTTESVLRSTVIRPLLWPISGHPTTAFNQRRIETLNNWPEFESSLPSGPKFVSIHLVMPHPPLLLNSGCEPDVSHGFREYTMNRWGYPSDELESRRAAYVEQVKCVNSVITEFLDQITDDSVVILAGDHGPDSFGTLGPDPSTWTTNQIVERLTTFTAIRAPSCPHKSMDSDRLLVNIFPRVLSCLGYDVPKRDFEVYAGSYEGPISRITDADTIGAVRER